MTQTQPPKRIPYGVADYGRLRRANAYYAESQLRQYAADPRIQQVATQVTLKKLVLIYKGWELIYANELA